MPTKPHPPQDHAKCRRALPASLPLALYECAQELASSLVEAKVRLEEAIYRGLLVSRGKGSGDN